LFPVNDEKLAGYDGTPLCHSGKLFSIYR